MLEGHKGTKLRKPYFSKKLSFLRFWVKRGQNGAKTSFFGIFWKSLETIFWFFAWKRSIMHFFWRKMHVRQNSPSQVRGQKGGQNGSPGESFGFFFKSHEQILFIFGSLIEEICGIVLMQTVCSYHFSFWSYGPKGGLKTGQNKTLSDFSQEVPEGFSWLLTWKYRFIKGLN